MTLDLDNVYKTLLGRGPAAYGGGKIQDSAREYWNNQYTAAGGGAAGLASVTSGIKGSQEYKNLGLEADFDHDANPYAAESRVQAQKSIARGDGVRRGSVASYSDMFNPDGTQRDDWVDEATWNQNTIEGLQDQINSGNNNQNNEQYDALLASFNELQGTLGTYQSRINDLQKAYDQQGIDMQNQWNNMNWNQNRPQNMSVRGVRTQNELPGWMPRTGGTRGFWGRGGGGNMLKTSSLNI